MPHTRAPAGGCCINRTLPEAHVPAKTYTDVTLTVIWGLVENTSSAPVITEVRCSEDLWKRNEGDEKL